MTRSVPLTIEGRAALYAIDGQLISAKVSTPSDALRPRV